MNRYYSATHPLYITLCCHYNISDMLILLRGYTPDVWLVRNTAMRMPICSIIHRAIFMEYPICVFLYWYSHRNSAFFCNKTQASHSGIVLAFYQCFHWLNYTQPRMHLAIKLQFFYRLVLFLSLLQNTFFNEFRNKYKRTSSTYASGFKIFIHFAWVVIKLTWCCFNSVV